MTEAVLNKQEPSVNRSIKLPPAAMPVHPDPYIAILGVGAIANSRRSGYRFGSTDCLFGYQIEQENKPAVLLDIHKNLSREEVEYKTSRAIEKGEVYIFFPRFVHGNTPDKLLELVKDGISALKKSKQSESKKDKK